MILLYNFTNPRPSSSESSTLGLSSLYSSFNQLCPLSSRPKCASPPAPWLSMVLWSNWRKLIAFERRWRKTLQNSDFTSYCSLLSTFTHELTSCKSLEPNLKNLTLSYALCHLFFQSSLIERSTILEILFSKLLVGCHAHTRPCCPIPCFFSISTTQTV